MQKNCKGISSTYINITRPNSTPVFSTASH